MWCEGDQAYRTTAASHQSLHTLCHLPPSSTLFQAADTCAADVSISYITVSDRNVTTAQNQYYRDITFFVTQRVQIISLY
jgi:hypothetical protein